MKPKVFIAGATGVVGRRLCRLLVADGWLVTGMTRYPDKAAVLRELAVNPVVIDVFDAVLLNRVVVEIQPDMIVHQLTDLPPALDPARMPEAAIRNARIRELGTRNLITAALAAGVKKFVAQSIAFAYAPGPLPYHENAPLNITGSDRAGISARSVAGLEKQVLQAPLEGVVLRYGRFYGAGTGFDHPLPGGALHVDAAADAARRALVHGKKGIYNIAETDGTVSSRKAAAELDWNPDFRIEKKQPSFHPAPAQPA